MRYLDAVADSDALVSFGVPVALPGRVHCILSQPVFAPTGKLASVRSHVRNCDLIAAVTPHNYVVPGERVYRVHYDQHCAYETLSGMEFIGSSFHINNITQNDLFFSFRFLSNLVLSRARGKTRGRALFVLCISS